MDKKFVYADNAATTRTCEEAIEAMQPYFTKYYGNPSSIYSFANESRKALANARQVIAEAINADPGEIIFTSGGTEADNHALIGAAYAGVKKGKHIITSKIEHPAVLQAAKRLEKDGFEVTYLDVDEYGTIWPDTLRKAIKLDTTVVSIMTANNEIGTIQPIKELAAVAKENKIFFHTDAVQAVGHIPIDVLDLNVDALSLSAHKFYGPKGVGALYLRKGSRVERLIEGGGQERGRRSGTENVAAIAGMAAALRASVKNMKQEGKRLEKLCKRLSDGLLKIPHVSLSGHPENRLPGLCSAIVEFIEGESMILLLDMEGICASTGSACSTGSLDPSHVLMAIGLPHEVAHGSLRLSLGRYETEQDVDYILEKLVPIVEKLRAMSPVWPYK